MILNLISNYINFIHNNLFSLILICFLLIYYMDQPNAVYFYLFSYFFIIYLLLRASYFVLCCILIFNLASVVFLNFMFINYFRFDMDFLDINLDWEFEDIPTDSRIEDLIKQTEITKYDNVCSICLNKFNNNDSKIIMYYICSNQHYFHKKCINQWLKIKLDCPICRQKIS